MMNERIKELALRAGRGSLPYGEIELQQFAELIVKDCADAADSMADDDTFDEWVACAVAGEEGYTATLVEGNNTVLY